ncbi:hypothetical protein HU200_007549 [Digitaria exilis]|uniref:Uncharacterized protein n=1 Tax=Digitaria exilis TaxID=1010633 RepID=A0A835KPP4_9POAL|nr:hypothetical protein HU200_007549 [Digitaria exilis]
MQRPEAATTSTSWTPISSSAWPRRRGATRATSPTSTPTRPAGEDARSALALAALCLDHAPDHHRWHHHTVAGARTFAFLSAGDGRTYFAAADPTPGAAEVVRFLERVRDACDAAPRRRLRDEAFAELLRAVAGSGGAGGSAAALPGASPQARLLPPTPAGAGVRGGRRATSRRATGSGKRAAGWWRSWWRHAVVVIGVDVVVCLVLFAVWMGGVQL